MIGGGGGGVGGGGGGGLAEKSKKQRLKDPYNSSYHTKAKFSDNFNPKYF